LRLPVSQSCLPMAPGRFRSAVRGDLARQGPGFRGAGLPLLRQCLWLPVPSGSDSRDVVPLGAPDPRAHGRTRRPPPSSPYRRVVPARRRRGALVRRFSAPLARRRPAWRAPRPVGIVKSARNRAGSIRWSIIDSKILVFSGYAIDSVRFTSAFRQKLPQTAAAPPSAPTREDPVGPAATAIKIAWSLKSWDEAWEDRPLARRCHHHRSIVVPRIGRSS
jgi:hypothetical protein